MIRRFRSPSLAAIALVAVLAVAPTGVGRPGAPTAGPARSVDAAPILHPQDAICWEFVSQSVCLIPQDTTCYKSAPQKCVVRLAASAPVQLPITVRYRTVPITAKPQVDYVDVPAGVLVIQPGASGGETTIQLLPGGNSSQLKTFGVEFAAPSNGTLARPQALVTIKQ